MELPSEAQSECACRAGTTTTWTCGDDEEQLGEFASYVSNARQTTHAVGGLKPNAFGLNDVHGNVWERCQDVVVEKAHNHDGAPTDGTARATGGATRVYRGASWTDPDVAARSTRRVRGVACLRRLILGLRPARRVATGLRS